MITIIYLDYAASAPPYEQVYPHMTAVVSEVFGNPSSLHGAGAAARKLLRQSRCRLAELLGCDPQHVIFTSGGTESNNTALLAVQNSPKRRIVISATEHPSVLRAAERLKTQGFSIVYVQPDARGIILPDAVRRALDRDTALLSVHAVNNETGIMQNIAAMAEAAHQVGALYHCDAVQAFGHVDLPLSCADLVSLSGHKFGGPRGVGVLMAKDTSLLSPLLVGGHQEFSLRAGTENLPGIAGFTLAAELALGEQAAEHSRLGSLSSLLWDLLARDIPGITLNGGDAPRFSGLMSLRFPGVKAEELQSRLSEAGICVGVGAACASSNPSPSHVLTAMGLTKKEAAETLRISLGRGTTEEEIRTTAQALINIFRSCSSI